MLRFHFSNFLILQLMLQQWNTSSAFTTTTTSTTRTTRISTTATTTSSLKISSSDAARDLLYKDQQIAMERRATKELELLNKENTVKLKELLAPKIKMPLQKTRSGAGFGSAAKEKIPTNNPKKRAMAAEQAKIVHRDGVLRINNALSPGLTDQFRSYVLEQQQLANIETSKDPHLSKSFYGVENQRKNRCDLQLSLLRGGYAADRNRPSGDECEDSTHNDHDHTLADALQELLGEDGTLRFLYEHLVTMDGEFYELASVITDPGSIRQQIHPDLPYRDTAPLYVIFLALQDVDEHMGPTTFLLKTHSAKENAIFHSGDVVLKDEQLAKANSRLATLKKGDAALFDARILHCGNANDATKGSTRALFNFSFRNPKVTGDLGYEGSIRPGYCGAMTLRDVSDALVAYENGDKDPFEKYADGLL
mmetsp:Transcript_20906/g.31854  ORF Transcript_20906/g.31854 Transcript_20906/m.31854 type:complete len:422 (+) Transcript_20906:162-1427(+)